MIELMEAIAVVLLFCGVLGVGLGIAAKIVLFIVGLGNKNE